MGTGSKWPFLLGVGRAEGRCRCSRCHRFLRTAVKRPSLGAQHILFECWAVIWQNITCWSICLWHVYCAQFCYCCPTNPHQAEATQDMRATVVTCSMPWSIGLRIAVETVYLLLCCKVIDWLVGYQIEGSIKVWTFIEEGRGESFKKTNLQDETLVQNSEKKLSDT